MKYQLTEETRIFRGRTLHRIKALRDITLKGAFEIRRIKKGDLGGWVETRRNLSQGDNSSWILDDGIVFGNAQIKKNAVVENNAVVHGNACVDGNASVRGSAHVFGNAVILDNSIVSGKSQVFGDARIRGYAEVFGFAHVFGNSRVSEHSFIGGNTFVCGDARISDHASILDNSTISGQSSIGGYSQIYGDAKIYGSIIGKDPNIGNRAFIKGYRDYLTIGPIGSRDDYTTFYKSRDDIMVCCGCFNDTLDKFRIAVLDTHDCDLNNLEPYLMAANLAEKMLG